MKILMMFLMVSQIAMAENSTSYLSQAKQVGDHVWIGPQLTEQDIKELAAEKITAVINNRTQSEMSQLEFNEAEQLNALNINYGVVEIGRGHAYSPAKLESFNDLMAANAGNKMVLHCRSGNRSSQLYAAWLIKYQNKSEAEALRAIHSEETELNDSIKALLGR